jgi:hypothetical protein
MISGTGAASFDGAGRRGTSRAIVVDGVATPGGTEEQFRASLPAHYQDPECAGLVMFPLRWVGLLEGAGSGLALRAALDRMLPGPTAADLLSALPPTAPREEKAAAALVTSYRRDGNTARGRAQGLRAAVPTTPPPAGPTEEQVAAARAELDASAAAREDLAAWQVEDAEHRAGAAAVADWQRRRDAIVAPECERVLVTAELEQAAEAERTGNAEVERAFEAYRSGLSACASARERAADWDRRAANLTEPTEPGPTTAEIDAAREAIAAWEKQERAPRPTQPILVRDWVALSTATPCPGAKTCQISTRSQDDADQRNAEHAAVWATWDAWGAAQIPAPAHARAVMDRAEAWARYNSRLSDLGKRPEVPPAPEPVQAIYAIGAAQEALDAARTNARAWATHDARVEALGARPADPAPLRARPEAADVAAATETIASAKRAADRLADHLAAVARAEAVASSAETDAAQAEQLLATAEGWLVAVRSAPARALASKLALLGDGALQVLDVEGKTKVEINGRPWYLASHGERVAADAGFRLRLRAAAGLDALLVFVDDVTSVGGIEIPTAPGVVLLVTTAAGEMEVAVG